MRIRERELGFTLLEVVFAMAILAVALMAMGKMQTRAIDAGSYSGRMATALRVAQDVIEQYQRDGGATAAVPGTFTQACPGGADVGTVTCPVLLDPEGRLGMFTRTWIVTANPSFAGSAVTQVTVTVTWGTGMHVTLNSLVT
jgi:prepilin-type N-terminal cleavage/methylation domain-containing protein